MKKCTMKRYDLLFILMLILFVSNAKAQECIKYRIIDDTISTSLDRPILKFAIQLTNLSDTNLLMYGFRNVVLVAPELDSTHIVGAAARDMGGNSLLLAKDGDRAGIWKNINSIHDQDLTGAFQEIRDILIKNSVENLEVLNGGCSKEVEMILDLSDYGPLERGIYTYYLIYSSGSLTEQVLDHVLMEDRAKYKAKLFSGYVISKQATIVIK